MNDFDNIPSDNEFTDDMTVSSEEVYGDENNSENESIEQPIDDTPLGEIYGG